MNFLRNGSSFFKKASPVFSNLFQQGRNLTSQVPSIIEQGKELAYKASPILGNIARIMDKAGEIGGKISQNESLTSIQSPQLQQGLSLLGKISGYATKGSKIMHSADKFVRPDTYSQGNEANLTNALEPAKEIKKEASNIFV